jgi:hypothetical protein
MKWIQLLNMPEGQDQGFRSECNQQELARKARVGTTKRERSEVRNLTPEV